MLFRSFTWQHFLIAAAVLTSLWYFIVLPLLYRKQLKTWLEKRGQERSVPPLKKDWDEEFEVGPEQIAENEDLLGKPKLPEGVSRLETHTFGFAPQIDEDRRDMLRSLVPDAIEELKNIFHVLDKEQGGKDDFIALFGLVKAKYVLLRDTASQRALNDYIRENALFPISDDELTQLWN